MGWTREESWVYEEDPTDAVEGRDYETVKLTPLFGGLKVSTAYFKESKKYQTMMLPQFRMTGLDIMRRYRPKKIQRIVTGYESLCPLLDVKEHDNIDDALTYHDEWTVKMKDLYDAR